MDRIRTNKIMSKKKELKRLYEICKVCFKEVVGGVKNKQFSLKKLQSKMKLLIYKNI